MRKLAYSLVFLGFVGCGGLPPSGSGPSGTPGPGQPATNGPRLKALNVTMGGLSVQLQTLWDSQAREFCSISGVINGAVYCQSAEGIAAGRPLSAYASAQVQPPN